MSLPSLKGNSSSLQPERLTESSCSLHRSSSLSSFSSPPIPPMAAASKSSQKVKNVVIALLALWSIISLIVIVVWATSPGMKGAPQCRAELQEVTEKMEGAKVVYNKNKEALEMMVSEERRKTDQQRTENLVLLGQLNTTNATLEECRQENVSSVIYLFIILAPPLLPMGGIYVRLIM